MGAEGRVKEVRGMRIMAEITIDETGIMEQMKVVKEIGDKYEDEILKLRGMLVDGRAKAIVEKEIAEEK